MLEVNQIYNMDCIEGLKLLNDGSINCCVTSPPYWGLRDYGVSGQIGLESNPEEFVQKVVDVFREVRRVLRKDGTLWLNMGDSYCSTAPGTMGDNIHIQGTKEATKRARKLMRPETPSGLKPKDLMGMPWRIAFALQADGWYLRSDIIWHKPNPMPESVKDRPTKAHEYIFLMSKNRTYYYDSEAVKEPVICPESNTPEDIQRAMIRKRVTDPKNLSYHVPSGWDTDKGYHGSFHKDGRRQKGNAKTFRGGGTYTQGRSFDNSGEYERESHGNVPNETGLRNKRTVWTVATQPFPEAHFATFPPKLIEPCILAGCPVGGVVLDPFMGSGTTAMVAIQNQRNFIGFELNPDYIRIAEDVRMNNVQIKMTL